MGVQFKLYTGVLKAWADDATGDRFLSGTTSSTIRDLQGDEMTLRALESMRTSALDNMTIFLNHKYEVPEDVFGSVVDARIVKRTDPKDGEVFDLDLTVKVAPDDENPRAGKVFRSVERGRKLGLSIGAQVESVSRKTAEDGTDTFVIDELRLLESSVVGIPANQRSYLQSAVKALRGQSESASESGIELDLELAGRGDRVREGIAKNEADHENRGAATTATPEGDVLPDDDVTAEVTDLDTALEAVAEAMTAAEPPAAPVVAETPAEAPAESEAEPEAIAAAAQVGAAKSMGDADDALSYAYLLESVLNRLNSCDDPEDAAVLQSIATQLQGLIASEVAELAPEAVMASFGPLTQKAVDVATAAIRESRELRKQLAEVSKQRDDAAADLAASLELLEKALALPVGRKSAVAAVTQEATSYPWLAPAVAERLQPKQ